MEMLTILPTIIVFLFLFSGCMAQIQYNGGRIIESIEITLVTFGQIPVDKLKEYESYYKDVTMAPSASLKSLMEYSTPTQKITGTGKFMGTVSAASSIGKDISEAQIVDGLRNLVKKKIIVPNKNSYYAVHLPPNVNTHISYNGVVSKVCEQFFAYHSFTPIGSLPGYTGFPKLVYGVIPDSGSMCKGGDDTLKGAAFPIMGSITNPDLDAWRAKGFNTEIGNLCDDRPVLVKFANGNKRYHHSYWSNAKNACADFGERVNILEDTAQLIQWQGGARKR